MQDGQASAAQLRTVPMKGEIKEERAKGAGKTLRSDDSCYLVIAMRFNPPSALSLRAMLKEGGESATPLGRVCCS